MSGIIFLLAFYWWMAFSLYNFLTFLRKGQDQLYVRWHSRQWCYGFWLAGSI